MGLLTAEGISNGLKKLHLKQWFWMDLSSTKSPDQGQVIHFEQFAANAIWPQVLGTGGGKQGMTHGHT